VFPAGVSGIADATRCVTGLIPASIVSLPYSFFGLDREDVAQMAGASAARVVAALGLTAE
jgi:hypothetical protein